MNVPRLNRRLLLETPDQVSDGAGGFNVVWRQLGWLWGEMTARTGRERGLSEANVSQVRYRIVVRGAPYGAAQRPLPEQRFREGARIFIIRAVAERGVDGRYLTCFVDEEVAA